MKKRIYRTITGRHLDLAGLGQAERDFLGAVQAKYEAAPEWSAFAGWWTSELNAAGLSERSAAYRICQDLEARLGIAQGKVAPPDNRDYLAVLIEERHGSRAGDPARGRSGGARQPGAGGHGPGQRNAVSPRPWAGLGPSLTALVRPPAPSSAADGRARRAVGRRLTS